MCWLVRVRTHLEFNTIQIGSYIFKQYTHNIMILPIDSITGACQIGTNIPFLLIILVRVLRVQSEIESRRCYHRYILRALLL